MLSQTWSRKESNVVCDCKVNFNFLVFVCKKEERKEFLLCHCRVVISFQYFYLFVWNNHQLSGEKSSLIQMRDSCWISLWWTHDMIVSCWWCHFKALKHSTNVSFNTLQILFAQKIQKKREYSSIQVSQDMMQNAKLIANFVCTVTWFFWSLVSTILCQRIWVQAKTVSKYIKLSCQRTI